MHWIPSELWSYIDRRWTCMNWDCLGIEVSCGGKCVDTYLIDFRQENTVAVYFRFSCSRINFKSTKLKLKIQVLYYKLRHIESEDLTSNAVYRKVQEDSFSTSCVSHKNLLTNWLTNVTQKLASHFKGRSKLEMLLTEEAVKLVRTWSSCWNATGFSFKELAHPLHNLSTLCAVRLELFYTSLLYFLCHRSQCW